MNGNRRSSSFIVKLSMSAVALLFSQLAFAVGTDAGTDVDNLATVNYEVNANAQQAIESAPGAGNSVPGAGNGTTTTFVVDNRVDFSLVQVGGVHTSVTPGDTDAVVEFLLTNVGNSAQDFRMTVTNLASTDPAVFTLSDTDVDLNNLRIRVGNAGGGAAPVLTDLDYADELAEDGSVRVFVYGDADLVLGLVNNDVANIDLTATVAAAGTASALGADLSDDVGNPDTAGLEVVFAEGSALGDGVESDQHGFIVSSAGLTVSKAATVIDDPINGTTNPKAIPGATVEYVVTVSNTGTADADAVSITDDLDSDVTFVTDFYAGQDLQIVNDGTTITPCNADAGDGDSDGCALDALALTVGNGNLAITVAAGTDLVVTYRVLIP